MPREVTSVENLRAIVGHPLAATANKVKDRLSEAQQDWLSHSPLGFLATTDADGRVDVSPKGDPPGFVHIIDATTIAIPERPGNRRVDGYLNVLQRPHVGTVFLIPGRGDTLRINGTAGSWPTRLLRRDGRQRQATDPGTRDRRRRGVLPLRQGVPAIRRVEAGDVGPDRGAAASRNWQGPSSPTSDERLEDYYAEENLRETLY